MMTPTLIGRVGTGAYSLPERVDGARFDLAVEFLLNPTGTHSEELQLLLSKMRADTSRGRFVALAASDLASGWVLAEVPLRRGDALRVVGAARSLEDLERLAFAMRWRLHTGEELPGSLAVGTP